MIIFKIDILSMPLIIKLYHMYWVFILNTYKYLKISSVLNEIQNAN